MSSKKTLDVWLNDKGYYRKHMAVDETCLFRAISDQIYNTQVYHERIRIECIEFANKNRKLFNDLIKDWTDYLNKLKEHYLHCGNTEIQIASKMLQYDIIIIDASNYSIENITKNNFGKTIMLCKLHDNHYDSVCRKEHIEISGFCQSIIYKLLYEQVFSFENVDDNVQIMLYKKDDDKKSDSNVTFSSKDSDILTNPPFPYKVAKALDPNQYRNIEFDAWSQTRRDYKLKDWYYGDDDLKVGTKCIFLQEKKTYDCYIQALNYENQENMCLIYVVEWAKKVTAQRDKLLPLPNAEPWPLPYSCTRGKNNLQNLSDTSSDSKYKKSFDNDDTDDNKYEQIAFCEGLPLNACAPPTNFSENEIICKENRDYFDGFNEPEPIVDYKSESDEEFFENADKFNSYNSDVISPSYNEESEIILQNYTVTQCYDAYVQQEAYFKITTFTSAVVEHTVHFSNYAPMADTCCLMPTSLPVQVPISAPSAETIATLQPSNMSVLDSVPVPFAVQATVPTDMPIAVSPPLPVPSLIPLCPLPATMSVPPSTIPLNPVIGNLAVPLCYCCNMPFQPNIVFFPTNIVPINPAMVPSMTSVPYQQIQSIIAPSLIDNVLYSNTQNF